MSSATFMEPFPHALSRWAVPPDLAERALSWMEGSAPWRLRVASFYEQWEMHLDGAALPVDLQDLLAPSTVALLVRELLSNGSEEKVLTEVTAHRMVSGQTIRIHNDYRPGGEVHRVLVQLNRGWTDDQGGLLMLFGSGNADHVSRVLRPVHGSGLGFRISESSFHAVSTITAGERFTLVYSFRETSD